MNQEIFQPVVALLLLTFVVWLNLLIRRVGYMKANRIHPESVKSPEQVAAKVTDYANAPANNFRNLTEVPIVFYVVCCVAYFVNQVDDMMIYMAWGFVLLRVVHSVIQCTYNRVMHRFAAYLASSFLVWLMLLRLAFGIF